MIPFEELVAALDRWRMRNGLPVVTGELPVSTSPSPATPVAGVPAWNTYAAPAASYAQAYAAPGAAASPAPAARPPTDSDVLALDDADVAAEEEDEALYQNEGDDFSMQFSGSQPAPAPAPAAPAPVYDEGEYGSYEDQQSYGGSQEYAQPAASGEYAAAGSYGEPPADEEHDAAGAIESEEEEEDWSKMPGFPGFGSDTVEADDDVVDERTVVGDDRRRDK
jgi:hypothetical protein